MVSATSRWRTPVCVLLAAFAPLSLCTVYVFFSRGQSLGHPVLDIGAFVLMLGSSVPFVASLPLSAGSRVAAGLLSLPLSFLLCTIWGLWLSCAVFHSCL